MMHTKLNGSLCFLCLPVFFSFFSGKNIKDNHDLSTFVNLMILFPSNAGDGFLFLWETVLHKFTFYHVSHKKTPKSKRLETYRVLYCRINIET